MLIRLLLFLPLQDYIDELVIVDLFLFQMVAFEGFRSELVPGILDGFSLALPLYELGIASLAYKGVQMTLQTKVVLDARPDSQNVFESIVRVNHMTLL